MSRRRTSHYCTSSRSRRSSQPWLIPVLVVAAALAIPAFSIALSESWSGGVAHAQSNQTFSPRAETATQMRATLRTHLRDDQIDAMKADYLRTRNATVLHRDLIRYADDVAERRYHHIPDNIRKIIRRHMSNKDIDNVKRWIVETKPTADDLIFTAKTEFAEDLEQIADEREFRDKDLADER